MGYIVKMPKLGMDMDQGTIVQWFVEEGDDVTTGEIIAEMESEKTTGEIEVRETGVVHHVLLDVGESIRPGGSVAIVGDEEEDVSDLLAESRAAIPAEESAPGDTDDTASAVDAASPATTTSSDTSTTTEPSGASTTDVKATPRAKKRAAELNVHLAGIDGTGPQDAVTEDDVERAASESAEQAAPESEKTTGEPRVFASPSARRLARELGVEVERVTGSGPGGRVTDADIRAAAEADSEENAPTASSTADVEERPLSGMRRTIADRLGKSYREAVHVTIHRTADADALLDAAAAANDGLDEDVSVSDILLLALSATLKEYPAFNATFETDTHRLHETQNLCVAVDIEDGLIAPVIRNVGSLSLPELAAERRAVTTRALNGDYTMDDLTGGTFTVSNLGVLGVESFDPVINPPQVAILGVNAIQDAIVPTEDGVGVRKQISFDLSIDHRLVDGADAARFLATLCEHVENPWPVVLGAMTR